MERIMAHSIEFEGQTYRMHILELDDQGNVSLTPFEHETPNTRFINGHIRVTLRHSPLHLHIEE